MKIYKENNELVVRLPFTQHKSNPFDEEEEKELTNNLVGVITPQKWGMECTINQSIDMSYKGGAPQVGSPYIYFYGEVKEFKQLCIDLGISCIEYEQCDKCKEAIFGTSTMTDKGKFCFNCE